MPMTAEQEMAHLGESKGIANHDHDLIHDLGARLDALWRYDQYIANADWREELRQFWTEMKEQEQRNIERLKTLIATEVKQGCF